MKIESLRLRVNVAILATCVAVALSFGLLLYPFESSRRQAGMDKIRLLMSVLYEQNKTALANEVFAGQDLALRQTLEGMISVEGIAFAQVYGRDGHRLVSIGDAPPHLDPSPQVIQGIDLPSFSEIRKGAVDYAAF